MYSNRSFSCNSLTVLLLCFSLFFSVSCRREATGLNPGDFAPGFSLQDLEGNKKDLAHFRGKFVLLNFWATWCIPCLQEMPELERAYRSLKEKDFVVLAVGVEDTLDNLRAFRDKNDITFPILYDPKAKVKRLYDVRGFPESFVIDREGKLLMVQDPETDMPVVKLIGPKRWDSPKVLHHLTAKLENTTNH